MGEKTLPDSTIKLLSLEITWTGLYHAEHAPFIRQVESFGFGQPAVRRSLWTLVQKLIQKKRGNWIVVTS
jgi:hypothetical protein